MLIQVNLPNEEDTDTSVVLSALEVQIFIHIVDLAVDDGITVEEVEKIHEPKNRLPKSALNCHSPHNTHHDPAIELFHQGDFSRTLHQSGTKPVELFIVRLVWVVVCDTDSINMLCGILGLHLIIRCSHGDRLEGV